MKCSVQSKFSFPPFLLPINLFYLFTSGKATPRPSPSTPLSIVNLAESKNVLFPPFLLIHILFIYLLPGKPQHVLRPARLLTLTKPRYLLKHINSDHYN